jgi:VWFA-related protein
MSYFRNIFLVLVVLILGSAVWAQQQSLPDAPKPQSVPDAPSATRPTPPPPTNPPTQQQTAQPAQQNPAPPADDQQQAPPPKKPEIKTVPQGGETPAPPNAQDELYKFTKNVNFVSVPVTIKNQDGRPVFGLTKPDFSIYEDGVRQPIVFFTSDPFPISAAIVVDVGMPDIALKKVQETFPALIGSFSEYDEVSIYTFGNTVKQQQDFSAALGDRTATTFKRVKAEQGKTGGVAVADGPMVSGPSVNGMPFPSGRMHTPNTRTMDPSRVLNDAILRATIDLSKRPRGRRKVVFVISDGREDGSTASYEDVKKVLLSNEVILYAVGVDSAAIPGYGKLQKLRLPRQGYSNVLPKYAAATGGEVFDRFDRDSMEKAYSSLMEQARNQYTIGYTSPATLSTAYRDIEVRVDRPGLKVLARPGYYPLPPSRR